MPDRRTPGTRRSPARPFDARCAAWVRGTALPLCDGTALSAAVLLVMPDWRTAGYVLAALLMLNAGGMHRLRICLRVSDEVPRLATFAALPLVLLLPWVHQAVRLAVLGLTALAMLLATRAALYAALRVIHRHGRLTQRVLIVGTGQTGAEIGKILLEHPHLGLRPIGFVGSRPREPASALPVLGGLSEMAAVAAQRDIQVIILCFTGRGDADIVSVLRDRLLSADICVVPRLYELPAAIPPGCRDDLWGIPLIPLRPCGLPHPSQVVKRAFDLIFGTVLLVLFAPLLLLLIAVVSVRCGRPVFFRQLRVTRDGSHITITKLRTVAVQDSGTRWAVSPDECTPLGRWLRSTHLDELPQLLHVIRGQMSLVGPRPERPYFAARFAKMVPRYEDRHRVHSGMTGWAQVHGLNGDTSIPERARFDNYYIENWSLWLDITILARTLTQPLSGLMRGHGKRPAASASGSFTDRQPTAGHDARAGDATAPSANGASTSHQGIRTRSRA